MPRRVLLMISSMRGGGSERQTLLLLQHLDRQRFTPHLYLTQRAGDLLADIPSDVTVHVYSDATRATGFYYPGRALRHQVSHLQDLIRTESIDVIYDRTFHMTMIAGPAANAAGVPRVSTIVSPPDRALPMVESRFVWFKRRRLAKAYRLSRAVVAVSPTTAAAAEAYYRLPTDSVRVIMNPVDGQAVQKAAATSIFPRDQHTTLVVVGRMSEEKGHADLMQALALTESDWPQQQPPLRIWLIGDGPLRATLQSKSENLRLHEVLFHGVHPNPAPAIAAADALVLPSHFEGLPNVALEAMTLETPVIATTAPGNVDLEHAIWARPKDPQSLADAIMKFVHHRDLAAQNAQAAKLSVQKRHSIDNATHEIENLLDQP